MSGWTILTVRAVTNENYPNSKYDDSGRGDAQNDIAATMELDERIRKWTTHPRGYVYAYLNCSRYDFEFAEGLIEEYEKMVDDAVVLGANDTTDSGIARYYPGPFTGYFDSFEEYGNGMVGQEALHVINSRHDFHAQDPFHDKTGRRDDWCLEGGENQFPLNEPMDS